MSKIAPSKQVRQQLQALLDGGTFETLVSQFQLDLLRQQLGIDESGQAHAISA